MIKILQIITQIAIIGFLKFSSLTISANASKVLEQPEITAERRELRRLSRDECFYTEDCKFLDDILLSDDIQSDREYRGIEEKYFRMFEMMFRRREPYKYECMEEGKRVIELRYLYNNPRTKRPREWAGYMAHLFKNKSPGKWLDYVIFYSLKKRSIKMTINLFLGVAIYSEFYGVHGKHREILFDNLFELFAKDSIISGEYNFYNLVYTINGNGKDPRSNLELDLLEGVMRTMLLKVLRMLGIPFSADNRDAGLRIYEQIPLHPDDSFYSKRDCHLADDDELVTFKNVIMKKTPPNRISNDYKKILLTLIGMVRTGKNIISVKCSYWTENGEFSEFLELANTNRNLVGLTELTSDFNLDEMLGGIKSQLRHLEISFGVATSKYAEVIEFINGLNEINLKASLYYRHLGAQTIGAFLTSPGVKCILNLQIMDINDHLNTPDILNALKTAASSPKIAKLEFYNCRMSLEQFLLNEDFRVFRNKLRVLEVSSIGNLYNESISDADFMSLKIERLHIDIYNNEEEVMDFDQLMNRSVVTRKGFKYLIFKKIHNSENRKRIVNLRNKMRAEVLPAILTDFKLSGIGNIENVNYSCASGGYVYYELY